MIAIILLKLLIFIFAFIGIFSLGVFILSCISVIINPQFTIVDGKAKDKNENIRFIYLIITSIAWALVIILV